MVKAVKVLKIISSVFFLGVFLFTYSFLPVMVNVYPQKFGWSIHKEQLFYFVLGGFVLFNVFGLLLERLLAPFQGERLQAWTKGLSVIINFYLTFLIGYIGVINNPSHFQPGSYSYLNYLGPLLVLGWLLGLLFLIFKPDKNQLNSN